MFQHAERNKNIVLCVALTKKRLPLFQLRFFSLKEETSTSHEILMKDHISPTNRAKATQICFKRGLL